MLSTNISGPDSSTQNTCIVCIRNELNSIRVNALEHEPLHLNSVLQWHPNGGVTEIQLSTIVTADVAQRIKLKTLTGRNVATTTVVENQAPIGVFRAVQPAIGTKPQSPAIAQLKRPLTLFGDSVLIRYLEQFCILGNRWPHKTRPA
ncbi:hypothetical protein FKV24_016680 [Lysobacter maris]|uniref:Uncharacterized protein n=1 Tax=Marilutibacter maris TaxID=1605891 RepID=A0A508A079_9GAMM|nr:hypothetical protein [Lysobacter maris]KAB8166904.1 hypothetical protein FKV24_016680 [Lysobacter maris]